jgi:EAL domain-containing protein (putative c-di-GMP-specific phosphodiesterase class I)
MRFPALEKYLDRLHRDPQAATRIWLDAKGRAQGRYFNATLTSAFQPIRTLDSTDVVGFEGFARSYSNQDQGLCIWRLLDQAANDDESVELDRLCRMLHAINFYRQPASLDAALFLSVHARLLAAVDANHGFAFRRVLDALGLPHQKIVLQLPVITHDQHWLVHYVSGNYRRNCFRLAVNSVDAAQALVMLEQVRPDFIKLDRAGGGDEDAVSQLLSTAAQHKVHVIFKRVEKQETVALLRRLRMASGQRIHAQGLIWDIPKAELVGPEAPLAAVNPPHTVPYQPGIA